MIASVSGRPSVPARGIAGEEIRKSSRVVLADREDVEAELVGERRLLDEVPHPLLRGDAGGKVGEGRESELHACSVPSSCARNNYPYGRLPPAADVSTVPDGEHRHRPRLVVARCERPFSGYFRSAPAPIRTGDLRIRSGGSR